MAEDAPSHWPSTKCPSSPRGAGDQEFLIYTRHLISLARERFRESAPHTAEADESIRPILARVYAEVSDVHLNLDDPENLWSSIARLTWRKCGHQIRIEQRQGRASSHEGPAQKWGGELEGGLDLAEEKPTSRDLAVFEETLAHLFRKMQPHERPILERKLHGDPVKDVATALQFNERKVYRVLDRVKHLLLAMESSEACRG